MNANKPIAIVKIVNKAQLDAGYQVLNEDGTIDSHPWKVLDRAMTGAWIVAMPVMSTIDDISEIYKHGVEYDTDTGCWIDTYL